MWDELKENVPKLVLLLSLLCPKGSIILRSTIICMLLKQSNPKMSLLQRVISMMLYGNGVHKEVCMYVMIHYVNKVLISVHKLY